MAYTKNKNPKKSRKKKPRFIPLDISAHARRTILSVIGLAGLVVILAALFSIYATPENTVKRKIESIVADYYENYFYPQIIESNAIGTSDEKMPLTEVMARYTEPGFMAIPLEQLFIYDHQKYSGAAPVITEYCNTTTSTIKIYPDAPFGPTDYHVSYHYSCNF